METQITPQQREALAAHDGHPVRVEDNQTDKVYYLVESGAYLHLQGLQSEHDEHDQARLRRLIEEGIQSGDVSFDEAFSRLRTRAEELASDRA